MVIRILSFVKVTSSKTIAINNEIENFLQVVRGDELLYILDKKGNINVRKYKGKIILGEEEIYISSSRIASVRRETFENFVTYISIDIIKILNANIGGYILWIIDKDGNIILRNNILLDKCSREFLNKDITCMVIGLSTLSQINRVSFPTELFERLEMKDEDVIFLCLLKHDNIIVSYKTCDTLLGKTKVVTYGHVPEFSIPRVAKYILNIDDGDKILWLFDEEGNIIIRNDTLPDNCV